MKLKAILACDSNFGIGKSGTLTLAQETQTLERNSRGNLLDTM